MNIKTEIELVTGFLGSGKTTFINALLENTLSFKETVLIIQQEQGETEVKCIEKGKARCIIRQIDISRELKASYVSQLMEFYKPHRIIIEENGTKSLQELLSIFEDKALREFCREPIIYYMIEAAVFEIFYLNMKELMEPFIINSHLIMLNNCSSVSGEEKKAALKKIQQLNISAIILSNETIDETEEMLKKSDVLSNGIVKKLLIRLKNKQAKRSK